MNLYLSKPAATLKDQFYSLETSRDVADLLEVEYSLFMFLLYGKRLSQKYKRFKLRKKDGSFREISAPINPLKIIQAKLNQVLLAVYSSKPQVHSFLYEKSIVTNAKSHTRKNLILNLDLEDFFPSIHFGRVQGMFLGTPYLRNEEVARTLARLASLSSGLPQGAPSSPIISNMICGKLDSELLRACSTSKCFYTRYADDITISTYKPSFSPEIAIRTDDGYSISQTLEGIIVDNGFKIKDSKTRFRTRSQRQLVNNLTVNRFPNLPKSYFKQIRAMLYVWQKFGYEGAEEHFRQKYDKRHRSPWTKNPSFARVLKGKIEFVGMVRGRTDPKFLKLKEQLKALKPALYPNEPDELAELLLAFQELKEMQDVHRRGFLFQDFLNRFFTYYQIGIKKPFQRNEGAEQIDGAFELSGWYYLVECRWRKKLADTREIDGLQGQVSRSGKQTMGLFVSVNGWSEGAVATLPLHPEKAVILVNGSDIEDCLTHGGNFLDFLKEKIAQASTNSKFHLSFQEYQGLLP